MTDRRRLAFLALAAALAALPAGAQPRRYELDPEACRVEVHVRRSGVLGFLGHDHVIGAPLAEGTILADPERVSASSVALSFGAGSLVVEDPEGPAKDVPEVQAKMVGPDVLDAARHPAIRFASTQVEGEHEEGDLWRLRIRGTLDLHGVSREVSLRASVRLAEHALTASGEVELRQSDWGIEPVSVAGVVKVRDEILIRFSLVGRAAP